MQDPFDFTVLPEGFDELTETYASLPPLEPTQTDKANSLNRSVDSAPSSPLNNTNLPLKTTSSNFKKSTAQTQLFSGSHSKSHLCVPERHEYLAKSPIDSRLSKCSCTSCCAENILAMQNNVFIPSESYRPLRTARCEKKKPRKSVKFGHVQILTYDKNSGCVYDGSRVGIDFEAVTEEKKRQKK